MVRIQLRRHTFKLFREAFVKTIRDFFGKNYDASDIRKSIVAAVSIKVMEPVFESQTKQNLVPLKWVEIYHLLGFI